MTKQNFKKSLKITAKWEGGEVDHPDDPGGHTNLGITQATYNFWRKKWGQRAQSVAKITLAESERIYKEGFWDTVNADNLFAGVDLVTFDAGVNSGPGRARKWLVAGLDKSNNHVQTVKNICAKRLGFMKSLNIWKTFGKGWSRRVADVQAHGVAWAAAAMSLNVKEVLAEEATQSKAKANNQTGGAAATGGGAVGVDQVTDMPNWVNYGIGFAAFAIIAVLVIRVIINRQQAAAYAAVG